MLIRFKEGVPPWEHPTWRGGRLRPTTAPFVVWLVFGGVAAAFALATVVGNDGLFTHAAWTAREWAVLGFALAAAVSLGAAAAKARRWLRFRGTELRLETMPGVIGGRLTGTLHLTGPEEPGGFVRVEIVNLEQRSTRMGSSSDSGRMVTLERLWETCRRLRLDECAGRAGVRSIPVKVTIPYDTKDMTDRRTFDRGRGTVSYLWMLNVYLGDDVGQPDLEIALPVFRTADSDPRVVRRGKPPADDLATVEERLRVEGVRPRVQVNRGMATPRYSVPGWPGWRHALPPLVISACFLGFGGFLVRNLVREVSRMEAGRGALEVVSDLLFSGVTGAFGLLLSAIGLLCSAWLASTITRRDVFVESDHLVVRRTLLGLSRTSRIPVQRLRSIASETSGNSGGRKVYRVVAWWSPQGGGKNRKLLLGDCIGSKTEAGWWKAELTRARRGPRQARAASVA